MADFADGFLLGAATSSHQVEGDNTGNDWWAFEAEAGRIADGTRSGAACEWWAGRAEDDLRTAAELGHDAHRMSLEWSRLEPEPGVFDAAAFARYRAILEAGRGAGLRMFVTLNHFTLPRWVAVRGGWTHASTPTYFERFCERAARELGALVHAWATLNEPSVLAYMGYSGDRWPPAKANPIAGFVAIRRQLDAHARGYRAVHRALPDARVGLVVNMPRFDPADPARRRDRAAAFAQDWAFSGSTVHALLHGELRPPLSSWRRPAPELRATLDWIGLNFYGRYAVRFDPTKPGTAFGAHVQVPTVKTEDNDWGQPSPASMVAQLERLRALRVPLYVTENGTFGTDEEQVGFLESHLRALAAARRGGLDVRGYFAWSLLDNFEWAEGWRTHFGHLALDRATQTRRPRAVAERFARICRTRSVD
ncbi:MAG: glycoside hydrolase family 1 protein [Sandaracinaceae bacterium]